MKPAAFAFACLLLARPPCPAIVPSDQAVLDLQDGRAPQALEILQGQDDSPSQLARGLALRLLGREAESRRALEAAARLDPGGLDAALQAGQAALRAGDTKAARAHFERARARHPGSAEPWLGLASLESARRRWDAALAAFEAALKIEPARREARLGIADALLELGRARQAAEAREGALAPGAEDRELSLKQAALWFSLGEWDRAEAVMKRAGPPSSPEELFLAGALHFKRGRLEESEAHFRAALESRPGFDAARLNLGVALFTQGEESAALVEFERLRLSPSSGAAARGYHTAAREAAVDRRLLEGSQALLRGDAPAAVGLWTEARALHSPGRGIGRMIEELRKEFKPQAARLARQGAETWAGGRLEESVALWIQALRLDPDCAEASRGLKAAEADAQGLKAAYAAAADKAAAAGDYAAARTQAARLRALDPKAGDACAARVDEALVSKTRALAEEADSLAVMGAWPSALAAMDQALALRPGEPRLVARRAETKAAQRRAVAEALRSSAEAERSTKPEEALRLAESALSADPDDLEAGRTAARLAEVLRVTRVDSVQVRRWYYEGAYLYGAGRTAEALKVWDKALKARPKDPLLLQAAAAGRQKLRSLAELEGGGRQ